jgi:peptidoglycan/LPS O-acetylase OafA/YrhL
VTDTLVGLWSMSLLITVASDQNSWLSRVLSYKPLVFIGTFAYSIYLIHAPLLQILWQYLFVPFQSRPLLMFAVLAIIGTPIIIGLSYIFFLAFERPFLNKGKKTSRSATKVEAALQPRIVRFYE